MITYKGHTIELMPDGIYNLTSPSGEIIGEYDQSEWTLNEIKGLIDTQDD